MCTPRKRNSPESVDGSSSSQRRPFETNAVGIQTPASITASDQSGNPQSAASSHPEGAATDGSGGPQSFGTDEPFKARLPFHEDNEDVSVWRQRFFQCRAELEQERRQCRRAQTDLERESAQCRELQDQLQEEQELCRNLQMDLNYKQIQVRGVKDSFLLEQAQSARFKEGFEAERSARSMLEDALEYKTARCRQLESDLQRTRATSEKEMDERRAERAELELLRRNANELRHPLCKIRWPPHLPKSVATVPFSDNLSLVRTESARAIRLTQTEALISVIATALGLLVASARRIAYDFLKDEANAPCFIRRFGNSNYKIARENAAAGRDVGVRLLLHCLAHALVLIVVFLPDSGADAEVFGPIQKDRTVVAVTRGATGMFELVLPKPILNSDESDAGQADTTTAGSSSSKASFLYSPMMSSSRPM